MDIKKIVPWDWFKDEEEAGRSAASTSGRRVAAYSPLSPLHREIDRVFDDVFQGLGLPSIARVSSASPAMGSTKDLVLKPSVDITATNSEYTITAEVPGVSEDDVKLELADNTLTISGEKKFEAEKEDKDFYRVERSYGSFRRVITLPEDADRDNIDAKFKDGVLTVTLPRKAVSKPDVKVIDIKKAA